MPRPSKYVKDREDLDESKFKPKAKEVQKKFARQLYTLMVDRNLTQKDIAEKADVSVPSISQYYKCEQIPKITTIANLSDSYGVSVNYLLGRAVCPSPEDDEIHKKTGLSNDAIQKLKEYKYLLEELPEYTATYDSPNNEKTKEELWIREDITGGRSLASKDSMLSEFNKRGQSTKPPVMIFDTINKILAQNDNKLLTLITAYLYSIGFENKTIYVTSGKDLNISYPTDTSPFEDRLSIQADLAEFILLNIEQELKLMRNDIVSKRAIKDENTPNNKSENLLDIDNEHLDADNELSDIDNELSEGTEELEKQLEELRNGGYL